MNEATAKRTFDALSAGDGYVWDCLVVFKGGYFKANAIQLMQFPKVGASLKPIMLGSKSHYQHVYDLDLVKYTKEAVLEFLRFVYLSKTANLTTQSNQRYLAEEICPLAVEFEIAELQGNCVKALSSDSITVDDENFLRMAQLGGEMNSKPLVRKCLKIFQQKFAINAEDAIKEVRDGAPMFLNAVIADVHYRPPASVAPAIQQDTEAGFAIDPHDFDDELFDEVLSSDHFDETKHHLSDFEIHCCDATDRPIHCHRNILARVPHFRQMILQDCKETRRKFVEVKKERKVMIETLRYVYTGKNTDLLHTMKDQETLLAELVIDLAQLYGLYVLKQRCHEAMLECDIRYSNVLRLLGFAVLYELNKLKSKCLGYFFDNREVLLTTDQWLNAGVDVVRTVVESSTHFDVDPRFCVSDNHAVWIKGHGFESNKITVGYDLDTWTTPVQLDYRTVIIFTANRQARLFDVIDHSLTDFPPLLFDHRLGGSACLFNGDVYVTGGVDEFDDVAQDRKCERYNRATNKWERVAHMNIGRFAHALVLWKGSLLAIGGFDTGDSDFLIERYDAVADRWEVIRQNERRLSGSVFAAVINSELWVLTVDLEGLEVWKVDLDADTWVEIPKPSATMPVRCIFEREGKAHFIGSRLGSTFLFAFDEDANGWKEVFEISKSLFHAIPIVPGEL